MFNLLQKNSRMNGITGETIFYHVAKGGPAGGGFSTAEDLLKFDIALRSNKLINKESAELLMSAKPELNSLNYGYGFAV